MTPAQKLRELLATRPENPTADDMKNWWRSTGLLLPQLFEDVEGLDCDLVAERAEHRRTQDARAALRVELDATKAERDEAQMLCRDARIQAMDRGASFQQVTAEIADQRAENTRLMAMLGDAMKDIERLGAQIAERERMEAGHA